MAVPSLPLRQLTAVIDAVLIKVSGSTIIAVSLKVQLFASVIITVKVPAVKLLIFCVLIPLFQAKDKVPVPPVGVKVIVPSSAPLQEIAVGIGFAITGRGPLIETLSISLQPFTSVTVT